MDMVNAPLVRVNSCTVKLTVGHPVGLYERTGHKSKRTRFLGFFCLDSQALSN